MKNDYNSKRGDAREKIIDILPKIIIF